MGYGPRLAEIIAAPARVETFKKAGTSGVSIPMDYQQALAALWDRSAYERGYIADPFGDDASGRRGLRRTRALLHRLGDPNRDRRLVHVAGSKGKGSVATMIAAIATSAGYRTGITTSPHLHSFRERIAIDGRPIDEASFARLASDVLAAARALEADDPDVGRVTTFEFLIAMALLGFASANCDFAVLEVGLGGTFDATNVVLPLATVITTLDLEHTAVLGETIAEIAAAKAGIIKPGVPVIASAASPAAVGVIATVAAEHRSSLSVGGREWQWHGTWRDFNVKGPWGELAHLALNLPGQHQVENAATAIAALWEIREHIPVPESAIRDGLLAARLPGRFEHVMDGNGRTIILDGAHTPAAAAALTATLASEFPGRRAVVVFGAAADKNVTAIAAALAPITSHFVLTQSSNPRAATPLQLAEFLRPIGPPISQAPNVREALSLASEIAPPQDLLVVTGSLFVVADARVSLGLAITDSADGG